MKKILFNADDFGWTDGHNLAVEQAHAHGLLNRASLLCNGKAFETAVELAHRMPGLKVGVHLTLNEGRPLLAPGFLPNLTTRQGCFHDSLFSLLALWQRGSLIAEEAYWEWRAQIDRARRAGINITHLDSHKHVHMLPPLLEAMIALAQENGVDYVRLPLDSFDLAALRRGPAGIALRLLALRARCFLGAAGLRFADRFYGVAVSGAVTEQCLASILRQPFQGLTEVMVHPAVITPSVAELQRRYRWAARYRFEEELRVLCLRQPLEAFSV